MTALFHAINIGTLAGWLSMATFGTVALVVPGFRGAPVAIKMAHEVHPAPEDFTLGEAETAEEIPTTTAPTTTEAPAEILPAPPALPEITDFSPLPEIPEISRPVVTSSPSPAPASTPTRAQTKPRPSQPGKSTSTARPGGTSNTGNPGPPSPASQASAASRLAQGNMPKPSYPAQAKRAGQTGTVVIEFTIDPAGRVISAYPKSSSGWPLLDAEAVRTVRRWTFPAGGVMKLQRPIVFQLR
jgi:protein TonB